MQLGLLLALVAAIIISEHSPVEPVSALAWRLALAAGAGLAVVLWAVVGSVAVSRAVARDAQRRATWLGWFARIRQAHLIAWLLAVGVTFHTVGWPQIVRCNWHLDQVILLKDLVLLLPIWAPLLCSWAAFYEVDLAIYRATSHGDGRAGSPESSEIASRGQFVWLHARHYLGLCVLPVLLLMVFQDLLWLLVPTWKESEVAWLVLLVPVAVLMVGFPHMLSWIWSTSRLPDSPLRARLTGLTHRMGVGCRDFMIWRTDRQVFNAAVAGLIPSARYIYLTDALLLYLRDDEMEAVVAHELGHVRRRHLLLRILLLGLPLWIAANLQAFSPGGADLARIWASESAVDPGVTAHLLIGCVAFALAVFALGWYSRLLEHDADLCVLDAGQAETFIATIDRLSHLCHDRHRRATWLHPSTMARVHLLQRALGDPRVARSFRRRVRLVNRLLTLAWLVTPLAAALA